MPSDRSARCAVLALIGAMSLTLSNCGQGDDLAGPEPAALQVTTQTSGTATDPDGYTVSIDGSQPVPIALVDTLLESGVTPGEHTVDLGGISAGCTVQGGGLRALIATSGTTASADFTVTCTAPDEPLGAVLVAVTTSGVELDPDGYLVAIDPSHRRVVGSSDQVRIEGIAAGQRLVRLSGLAANCSVQGQNPTTVDVSPGEEAGTAFAVRCWPSATGSIAFARSSEGSGADFIEVVGIDGVPRPDFNASVPGGNPSWSADGRFLAFIGSTDLGEAAVFVQPLSGGTAVELAGCHPSGTRPIWSPDGSRLLCLTEAGRLFTVQRDGSGLRFLTPDDGSAVTSADYFPDGRIFFVAMVEEESFGAFRVAADGTALTLLFTLPFELTFSGGTVVPSPDGQRVAYALLSQFAQLFVANVDGTNARIVSSDIGVNDLVAPAWSPDASQVAFEGGGRLWLVKPDGADLAEVPLPGDLAEFGGLGFDWSPDGTRLVVSLGFVDTGGLHSSIYTIRADGSGLERLTASATVDLSPAWGR